ncbi:type 1 glutamine amidotransferase domain-containing protein [Leptospira brenneri]
MDFFYCELNLRDKHMILIPIPENDFDPSEVSIPWKILTTKGHKVVFATPSGKKGNADKRMLFGDGLGILKPILRAGGDARADFDLLEKDQNFLKPISYEQIEPNAYNGILLPGGHAKGMIPYLESKILQSIIVNFFDQKKPVGAICHGVLLVARSIDPNTNKSVLYNLSTTSLLKKQELLAYNLTKLWLGDYYLTYNITVEDEVKSFLKHSSQFQSGNLGIFRDKTNNTSAGFTVRDQNFISARWPGDAHKFGYEFAQLVESYST